MRVTSVGLSCGGTSTCLAVGHDFICDCAAGYSFRGNNLLCSKIEYCQNLRVQYKSCGGTSRCTEGDLQYVCDCANGWQYNGSNQPCIDKSSTCNGTGQLAGFGSCDCKVGYTGTPKWNGISWDNPCTEIDECMLHNVTCGGTATCEDSVNHYRCEGCADGWKFDAVDRPCADVDECAIERRIFADECGSNDGANTCINGRNSFSCQCGSGWEGGGYKDRCTEVDDCEGVVCGGDSTCVDHVAAFFCQCAHDWHGGGFNRNCSLIPHCDINVQNCGGKPNKCTNRIGAFFCTCAPGWTGGGLNTSCIAVTTTEQLEKNARDVSENIWQPSMIIVVAAGAAAIVFLVVGALLVIFVLRRRRLINKKKKKAVVTVSIPLMPTPTPKSNAFMVRR